jgi:hypothetical protein
MFKERDNKPYIGPQIGKVIIPPPDIKIALGDNIILEKDRLRISASVLNNYEREIEITNGEGVTTLVQPLPPDPPTTSETWGMTNTNIKGKMKYTDTLKSGDEVILIPSDDAQIYYLIDKVVRL